MYLHISLSIAFPPVLPFGEPAPSAIFDTEKSSTGKSLTQFPT